MTAPYCTFEITVQTFLPTYMFIGHYTFIDFAQFCNLNVYLRLFDTPELVLRDFSSGWVVRSVGADFENICLGMNRGKVSTPLWNRI